LYEVQRIKSEGDYEAGRKLVEDYAVKIDLELHKEVKERYDKLNIEPYSGFVNPDFVLIEKDGEIVDIELLYNNNYVEQMLNYSKNYSFLPLLN
jgi:dipeptidyl-peptidase-3